MTIQQAKDTVNSSFPSIWSREDVLALLDRVDEGMDTLSTEQIDQLSYNIAENIDGESVGVLRDYDLSMSNREVELDSVDFDIRVLKDIIKNNINDFIKELKEVTA